jgi:hypothetical protein
MNANLSLSDFAFTHCIEGFKSDVAIVLEILLAPRLDRPALVTDAETQHAPPQPTLKTIGHRADIFPIIRTVVLVQWKLLLLQIRLPSCPWADAKAIPIDLLSFKVFNFQAIGTKNLQYFCVVIFKLGWHQLMLINGLKSILLTYSTTTASGFLCHIFCTVQQALWSGKTLQRRLQFCVHAGCICKVNRRALGLVGGDLWIHPNFVYRLLTRPKLQFVLGNAMRISIYNVFYKIPSS